jgi:hypothetical protein
VSAERISLDTLYLRERCIPRFWGAITDYVRAFQWHAMVSSLEYELPDGTRRMGSCGCVRCKREARK